VLPQYDVVDRGPDHAKHFTATVSLGGRQRGQGEGRSKKQAEQAAARDAWEALREELDPDTARPDPNRPDPNRDAHA
jgi:ribonuclease III